MIDKLFNSLKKTAENNLKVLPKLEEFPIHDQTILVVYNQTYIITLIGLPTSSLIMQGVLMEMFVKFLYFHHKKEEFQGKLWKLIEVCYKEKLYSEDIKRNKEYYNFFDAFRDIIRNVQTHFLAKKQTQGLGVQGLKISLPLNLNGSINKEKFEKVIQDAKKNFAEKSEILLTDEHGFVANALKLQLDENSYLLQFCELDKAIKNLNKENNLDGKQK